MSSSTKPLFVSIAGMIGAGKTTLAQQFGREFDLPVYCEPVLDNEYLTDFYRDMSKHAFPMQIHLLTRRFEQQQQILWSGRGGVQDRTIYEDGIFASLLHSRGHIDARDYQTYLTLSQQMYRFMAAPDLIVYLDVSAEEALRRVQVRNRDCESGLTLDYLVALHAEYERFIHDISKRIPVLRVDWNEFQSVEKVAQRMRREYDELSMLRDVKWY